MKESAVTDGDIDYFNYIDIYKQNYLNLLVIIAISKCSKKYNYYSKSNYDSLVNENISIDKVNAIIILKFYITNK